MPAVHQGHTNGFGLEIGGTLGGLLNKVSIGGHWDSQNSNGRLKSGESTTRSIPNCMHYDRPTSYPPSPTKSISAMSNSSQATFPPPVLSPHLGPRAFPPPLAPRSYSILKEVGDGSFGTVWLADWHSPLQLPPGTLPPGPSSRPEYKGKKLVAIKRMKKAFEGGWDECMKLKELKSLRLIPMHANIIPLYDAFLLPSTKELYFVFECMEGNLYQLTKSRKGRPLASGLTASIFHQILSGLDHIHCSGYFHRDMKPENLLITTTGLADYPASSLYALPGATPEKDVVVVVKLADFGLARETSSKPPYTEYVSTRWYRAPEVLLRSRDYSNPVDMWALGTILVELITLKPLFPGDSEVDQVFKICEILGDPSSDYGVDEKRRVRGGGPWARGVNMAKDVGFAFPKMVPRSLASLFDTNTVPAQLIDCIADLLRYEPLHRLTTQQCLDHAYFREVAYRFAPYRALSTALPPPVPFAHGPPAAFATAARDLPTSHSTAGFYKPPFQTSNASSSSTLPPPEYAPNGYAEPPTLTRHYSVASSATGLSGYGVQLEREVVYDSPMTTFPDERAATNASWDTRQAAATATWNGVEPDPVRPIPAFGSHARRNSFTNSLAPSTLYDGSIYEGIQAPRGSSIMSFPVGYGALDNSPILSDPSHLHEDESMMDEVPIVRGNGAPSIRQPSPPQIKSKGWGFGSVFSGDKISSPFPAGPSNPLRRTPSDTSSVINYEVEGPRVPIDAKKAKKEAEKAAKEAEKRKRDAMQLASRERARAVMKKKSQLMEAADPLQHFGGNHPRTAVDKGKARASERPTNGGIPSGKMPQISENWSRLQAQDLRHKMRRREEDGDVHSVSSTDTGRSSQHRPYSVSSQATSRSDPEQYRLRQQQEIEISRVSSISSINSSASAVRAYNSHPYAPAPNTGHSSLDHQFIKNMQGLATTSSIRSESRSVRSASPRDALENRYSPYPFHATRPSGNLNTFAEYSAAQFGNMGQPGAQLMSSGASVASYHSVPGVLPSHQHLPQEQGLRQPYLPAMDTTTTPNGSTFPYPSQDQ